MPDSVPADWTTEPFTDFADVNPSRPLPAGRIAPFLEMAAVREGFRGIAYVGERAANGSGAKFRNGDTIFARITPCAENGKIAYIDFLDEGDVGFGSTEFIVFSPRDRRADSRFLYHLVASPQLHRRAISQMRGTSGRQRVPDDFFRQGLTVSVPPIDEQRRIAEVLDAIDAAIEKTEAVIAATERLRSALLAELLTRGVPGWHTEWKDVPGIGTIPACWEVVRLGDVAQIKYGTSTASTTKKDGLPVLRIPNVARGDVDLSDLKYAVVEGREAAEAEVHEGDLLVVRTNGNPRICGTLALVPRLPGRFLFASYLMRVRLAGGRIIPGFLAAFLNTTGRLQLHGRIRTSAGNYNVSASGLASVEVAAPSISEQRRIGDILGSLGTRVDEERHTLEGQSRAKSAVAAALLSGRLRVKVVQSDAG